MLDDESQRRIHHAEAGYTQKTLKWARYEIIVLKWQGFIAWRLFLEEVVSSRTFFLRPTVGSTPRSGEGILGCSGCQEYLTL